MFHKFNNLGYNTNYSLEYIRIVLPNSVPCFEAMFYFDCSMLCKYYVYIFPIHYLVKMQYNGFTRDRDKHCEKKETPQSNKMKIVLFLIQEKELERICPIQIVFTSKMIMHQTMNLIDNFFSVIKIQLSG